MARIRLLAVLFLGASFFISCNPREAAVNLAQSTAGLFELNTKVNQFVEESSGAPVEAEAGGYEIDLVMQAVKPGDLTGIDTFRITIDTRYGDKISSDAEGVPALRVDSLTIRTLANDSVFLPSVFADNFAERRDKPEIWNKKLLGPSYRYQLFKIPRKYPRIELWFDAVLIDRKSGSVVSRERVKRTLKWDSQLKYYQPPFY